MNIDAERDRLLILNENSGPVASRRLQDMLADFIRVQAAEIQRLRASVIEECAKVCEAQDATVNVYNNPLNGMKHPVAEQSYRRCAAAIRALKEREAGA